ncbi:hypothetical protein HNR06_000990 [Nocardiopsis arvandica]|uniref:CHAT domain-containing protein n=1 Tax=Nocardiopsis sinuspersici TaxID=501010 RepID=A0A7Y9X8Y2_9ACTN|nr:CHAT domain-containing protein [Nocardiopsis sinuspersici]NYH51401.1 hypothetical protein [Nocardiopsis sinuspersici]
MLDRAAVGELTRLAGYLDAHPDDLEVSHAVGWCHWFRYLALPQRQGGTDMHGAIRALAPCFLAGIQPLPEPLLPWLAKAAAPAATELLQQVLSSTDTRLLTTTVQVWERFLQAAPDDHPDRAWYSSNLATALQSRFTRMGDMADLDEAVTVGRQAVQATPDDHPDQAAMLSNLGAALRVRFRRMGDMADLDEALTVGRQAVQATPDDHPDQAAMLSNLGATLQVRFEHTGHMADLNEAITTGRQAVNTTPDNHPDQAGYLSRLGTTLRIRFEHTGHMADLNEAITTGRQAVNTTPDNHPDQAGYLSRLGIALQSRFEHTGHMADLNEAITTGRQAVQATSAGHFNWARYLSNLGTTLRARFRRMGDMADLDEALTVGRQAVQATPDDHPDQAAMLSNLGATLQVRFEHTGHMADLNEAITTGRQAVNTTPDNHPDQAGYLSNLGTTLRIRFEHTGHMADLNEAITTGRQAVNTTPDNHPNEAAMLSNLGAALQVRFRRRADMADLNEAITTGRQAVQATPDNHPNQTMYLSNLGGALQVRFGHTGHMADLNEAITTGRQAVNTTPDNHPDQAGYLSNLGTTLQVRFEHTGHMADLNEAVSVSRQAVNTTPNNHPNQTMHLSNLGTALQTRFERTSDAANLDQAVTAFSDAWQARFAPSIRRIQAGSALARLVSATDPVRAAEVWQGVVELLPQVVPRQLGRSDQQYELGRFFGLAGQAAAAVLSHPRLGERERAVRALAVVETGRGVLLSQALDTRNELTDLEHHAPELAATYVQLRDLLDRRTPITSPDYSKGNIPLAAAGWSDEGGAEEARAHEARLVQDRHRLVGEFDAVLEQIRALEGFATFGLPPSTQELLKEAAQGPVVVFTTAPARCDALLLTTTGVSHLELPGLTWETLVEKVNAFHQARARVQATTGAGESGDPQQVLTGILGWLWDVVAGPVLDALGFDTEPAGDEWPRVWWSPGGLLGQLPLHAAGHHSDPPGTRRTVMDCVVSSYTPTVRALRYAREQAARHEHGANTQDRALVVAMPTTPGHGALPFVAAEVDKVRDRVSDAIVLTEVDTASHSAGTASLAVPTRARVLEHLPEASIAHFACHGYTDPNDPSQSRLLLHDHAEAPLTVAELGAVRLDRARLAYLSACSTASTTTVDLLDEAIHVASAFQLAGFPHVVGTLWEVNDQVSATVADLFYTHLRAEGDQAIDPARAAHALHAAVRAARDGSDLQDTLPGWDRTAAPLLWAPYLHTGA